MISNSEKLPSLTIYIWEMRYGGKMDENHLTNQSISTILLTLVWITACLSFENGLLW